MLNKLSDAVVKHPWFFIVFFVGVSLFVGSFVRNAELDPDMLNMMDKSLPSRVSMDRIENIFGGTEMMMIILETDDVLNTDTLKRAKDISKQMVRVSEFDRVLSLFELKDIRGESGEMIVDPAVKRIPRDDEQREELRRNIIDNELVYKNVVSEDFKATAIIGMVRGGVNDEVILSKVNKILKESPGPEKLTIGGTPFVRASIAEGMEYDLQVFFPAGLLIMLVFLFFCFKQLRGVFLPFVVVVLSIMFTMGLIPILGWKIQVLMVILPVMLIAIANDYGIHLIARYQEDNYPGNDLTSKGLAQNMIQKLGIPVLATAITTIVGMLCLLSHRLVPAKEMGILAGVGIGWAFVGSILFIPAVIAVLPKSKPIVDLKNKQKKVSLLDRALAATARFVSRNPRRILAASALIAVIMGVGISFVIIDANPNSDFPENHPVRQANNLIDKYFGGGVSMSLLAEGDIKDPEVLHKIDELERALEAHEYVGQTSSLAKVVSRMNKVMNDGNPEYDRVPQTREAIAQYLLLYSMNGDPDDFDTMVDFPYENAHLTARINTFSSPKISEMVDFVEDFVEKQPDSPFTAVSGFAVFFNDLVNIIITGQIYSLTLSLFMITLLVAVLFRSIWAGLMASLTMVLAMIILFGLMGYGGIFLNTAAALLSSIMIGVGVDYTIHFMWRYREERRGGQNPEGAVVETLTTVGRGIVFNALSVAVGFTALLLSTFVPLRFFGFLVIVSVLACLLGALVLLPAIVLVFKPGFMESSKTG